MQCLRTDRSRYSFNHNQLFETPCLSLCVAKARKLVAAMYRKKETRVARTLTRSRHSQSKAVRRASPIWRNVPNNDMVKGSVKDGQSAAARLPRNSWRFPFCIFVAFGFVRYLALFNAFYPHIVDGQKRSAVLRIIVGFLYLAHLSCVHTRNNRGLDLWRVCSLLRFACGVYGQRATF